MLGSVSFRQLLFQNCSAKWHQYGYQYKLRFTLEQRLHLHRIGHSFTEGVLEVAIYLEIEKGGCFIESIANSIAATFTTTQQQLAYVTNSPARAGYYLMVQVQEELDIIAA